LGIFEEQILPGLELGRRQVQTANHAPDKPIVYLAE
jgi:hypothetical protein